MEQDLQQNCWNDKNHADHHKRFAWFLLSLSIIRIIFVSYNRELLCFLSDLNTFKTKYHIGRSLKIAITLQPAHSAFAMLQSYKLLSHFPATLRTYSISHKLLCTPYIIGNFDSSGFKVGIFPYTRMPIHYQRIFGQRFYIPLFHTAVYYQRFWYL